jgi:hypothetical protein
MKIVNVEPKKDSRNGCVAEFDVETKRAGHDWTDPGFVFWEKNGGTWVTGPSRKYEKDGETRYQQLGKFKDETVHRRYLAQIRDMFKKYLVENPNLEPVPVIGENNADDEIPF